MRPYWFVVDVTPSEANPNYEDVGGAKAHVFVMDSAYLKAKKRALHYISEELWNVGEVEYEFEPTQEQLLQLDTPTEALYRKALHNGIAVAFYGWKRVSGDPSDPIECRFSPSLYPPKEDE